MTRVPCTIIACRESKKGDPEQEWWICRYHWALIPRKYKKLYRGAVAAYDADPHEANAARCRRVWERMMIAAVERAAGIA